MNIKMTSENLNQATRTCLVLDRIGTPWQHAGAESSAWEPALGSIAPAVTAEQLADWFGPISLPSIRESRVYRRNCRRAGR